MSHAPGISIVGIALVAVGIFLGLNSVAPASASAAVRCAVVAEVGTGNWDNAACNVADKSNEYIKVITGGKDLGGGIECAVVAEVGTGRYSDAECTKLGGSKEYIKVIKAVGAPAAPRWHVNGAELANGTPKTIEGTSTTTVTLKIPAFALTLSSTSGDCTAKGEIVGSKAESPGTERAVVLTCKNVTVENAPKCTARSSGEPAGSTTIATNKLKSTLVWSEQAGSSAVGDLFQPEAGEEYVKLIFEGTGCALAGEYPVTNAIIGEATPVGEEKEEGTLAFPSTSILSYWNNASTREAVTISQLAVKRQKATFTGSFNVKLNPKVKFGIFPG